MDPVTSFDGRYKFLSNFYSAPTYYEGIHYPTSEHAYQAAKTLSYSEREEVRTARWPSAAKRLGRSVTLRPDWKEVKVEIMKEIVLDKFTRNVDLMEKLVATRDAVLVEGNYWGDTFWGMCKGKGQNWLGKILMEIRARQMNLKEPK